MTAILRDAADNIGMFAFGPFKVNRVSRFVERDGEDIRLGSRAFDVLVCLLERAGHVVEKGEMLRRVWPHSIVEEGSLRFQINGLRKALGEGRYIANVTGRGYAFVVPVSCIRNDGFAGQSLPSAPQVSFNHDIWAVRMTKSHCDKPRRLGDP
jgi:DNA-binding winged helix-turn-helix (wHTH) protein